jgi:hypothetical protein
MLSSFVNAPESLIHNGLKDLQIYQYDPIRVSESLKHTYFRVFESRWG